MFAAVQQDAAGYEGLRNYIIGGGRRPTGVTAFDASARQPAGVPGSAVPGAPGTIPTSSARPGKATNQRVTYARLTTKFSVPGTDGFDPESVNEGDIVFVHRYDGMNCGHDVNKPTRTATLAQLNGVLRNYNRPAPADLAAQYAPLPQNADFGNVVMPFDDGAGNAYDPAGITTPPVEPAAPVNPAQPTPAEVALTDEYLRQKELYELDYPKYRWKHCRMLGDWTLDGICCGTEHEHREEHLVGASSSNPGELYNIAVGGPTIMRNAANHRHNMDLPEQHVDDGMRTLDKVFVGLVCYEQRDENGDVTHYMYQYKPFTSRQLAWASFQRVGAVYATDDRMVPGGNNTLGPTVGDFQRMCCVWRLGTVLDTQSGMMPYRCATINVVVEEWPIEKMGEEYNRFFGASFYLAVVPAALVPLIEAAALLLFAGAGPLLAGVLDGSGQPSANTPAVDEIASAHAAWQTWMRTDGIDPMQLALDVREWTAIDKEWFDERFVTRARWATAPIDPNQQAGQPIRRLDYRTDTYVREPVHARPRMRQLRLEERVMDRLVFQGRRPNLSADQVADGLAADTLRVGLVAAPPLDPYNTPETLEAQRLYEPPSPSSQAFWARLIDAVTGRLVPGTDARTIDNLANPAAPSLRLTLPTTGRVAALVDSPDFDTYTPAQRAVIRRADEVHSHWLGIRPAVSFIRNFDVAGSATAAKPDEYFWPLYS